MSNHNPHDHFFRESFGRPEIVRSYLQEYIRSIARQLLELHDVVTVSEITGLSLEDVQALAESDDSGLENGR
jgi:hypothetical protein